MGARLTMLLVFLASLSYGQVKFYASVDAQEILKESYLKLSITVENARLSSFKLPELKDFVVKQGPITRTSSNLSNNKRTSKASLTYVLQPKRLGTLKIPSFSVTINGKKMSTKSLSVDVLKTINGNKKSRGTFLEMNISDSTAYLGQQVLIEYTLYRLAQENYNRVSLLKEDPFEGFFVSPIDDYSKSAQRRIINGEEYIVESVRKVGLFPQTAGRFELEPMSLRLSEGFFSSAADRKVMSNSVNLIVNPLPSNSNSCGAVGSYQIACQTNKTSITQDQSITLNLALFGNGDAKLLRPPKLNLTDSLEVYEPNFLGEQQYVDQGMLKHKTVYEYLLIPKYMGRYKLSPTVAFFNVDSNRYENASCSNIEFNVLRGSQRANTETTLSKRVNEMAAFQKDISVSKKSFSFFNSLPYWLLLGSLLSAYPIMGFLNHRKKQLANIDPELLKSQRAERMAKEKLTKAKTFMDQGDQRSFYNEISNSILGYASDKLKIPVSELSKENIAEKLTQLNIQSNSIDSISKILTSCELALFAGSNESEKMNDTYQNTLEGISNIEKQLAQ